MVNFLFSICIFCISAADCDILKKLYLNRKAPFMYRYVQNEAQIKLNPVLFSAPKYGNKPSWRGMIAMYNL